MSPLVSPCAPQLLTAERRLALLLVLFVLLGAADYLLTARLIRPGNRGVVEANPVAAWVLGRHGCAGLAVFKAGSMAVVAGLVLLIARLRPELGAGVLTFACAAATGVVLYSAGLLARPHLPRAGGAGEPEVSASADRERELERRMDLARAYQRAVVKAASQLEDGDITLAEAVARLQQLEQGRDPSWWQALRSLYGPVERPEHLLAASLVRVALNRANEGCQDELARRLKKEFQELCQVDFPGGNQVRAPGGEGAAAGS